MAGYTKEFSSQPGDLVNANLFNDEYQRIEDAFKPTGHSHDGLSENNGAYIPLISDINNRTSIEVDPMNKSIAINVEIGGIKTPHISIDETGIIPAGTNIVSLGSDTKRFKDITLAGQVNSNTLKLNDTVIVNQILSEDDLASNSFSALVTQRSIKTYVDTSIDAMPGIHRQSIFERRASDLALTGAMADYIEATITVEDGAYINIQCFLEAKGENSAGTILGRIYRDTLPLGTENFTIADSLVQTDVIASIFNPFYGSSVMIERDGPLIAGTYTYKLKARESITDGTALTGTILLEELA